MGREEFRVELTADDQASRVIDRVADEAEQLEEPIELTVDARVDKVLGAMRDVVTDAQKAEAAADALGRALGPELAGKADLSRVVADMERAGLSLDEIRNKADRLGAELRDIAGPGGAGLDALGKRIRATSDEGAAGLENMRRKGEGFQSALPALRGFTDELGGTAAQAGVAGQAIGDLGDLALIVGERFGLSERAMTRLGTALGALGIAAVGVGAVAAFVQKLGQNAQETAQRTEEFGDAMRDASQDSAALADVLREDADALRDFNAASNQALGEFGIAVEQVVAGIPLLGSALDGLIESENLIDIFDRAGISFYDFAASIEQGGAVGAAGTDKLRDALREALETGKITADQYNAVSEAAVTYGKSATAAQQAQKLWNVDQAEANALLAETIAQSAPLEQYTDRWQQLFDDMRDGSIDSKATADAINFLADALGMTQAEVIALAQSELDSTLQDQARAADEAAEAAQEGAQRWREYLDVLSSGEWSNAGLEGGLQAMQQFNDELFGLTRISADYQSSLDGLTESLAVNGATFDVSTEAGRANQQALEGVAESLEVRLAAAYDNAGGSQARFAQDAQSVFDQLVADLGLGADEAAALAQQLGFTPEQITTRYELAGAAEAQLKLGLLQTAIGALPPEVQLRIGAQIAAGDFTGAVQSAQDAIATQQVNVSLGADPSAATSVISDVTGGDYDAVVDVEGNVRPAESDVGKFTGAKRETTPVVVQVNQAIAAAALLAFISRPRTTIIYVGTSGLPQVSGALNQVSQPRTAQINARLNAGGVSSQLDSIARDRSTTITARVVESDVARWYRLNGRVG